MTAKMFPNCRDRAADLKKRGSERHIFLPADEHLPYVNWNQATKIGNQTGYVGMRLAYANMGNSSDNNVNLARRML